MVTEIKNVPQMSYVQSNPYEALKLSSQYLLEEALKLTALEKQFAVH
jgi:hypothetical protein